MDNDPEQTVKITPEFLKKQRTQTQTKPYVRKTQKQAATEYSCRKDLAKHLKGGNSTFWDVHGFQISHRLEKLFIEVLKIMLMCIIM